MSHLQTSLATTQVPPPSGYLGVLPTCLTYVESIADIACTTQRARPSTLLQWEMLLLMQTLWKQSWRVCTSLQITLYSLSRFPREMDLVAIRLLLELLKTVSWSKIGRMKIHMLHSILIDCLGQKPCSVCISLMLILMVCVSQRDPENAIDCQNCVAFLLRMSKEHWVIREIRSKYVIMQRTQYASDRNDAISKPVWQVLFLLKTWQKAYNCLT